MITSNILPWLNTAPTGDKETTLEIHWDGTEAVVHHRAPDVSQGSPGVVHGGYLSAIADHLMGMTAGLRASAPMVTRHMELDYLRPVPTSYPLEIRTRVLEAEGRRMTVTLEISGASSTETLVTAKGLYVRVQKDDLLRYSREADIGNLEERLGSDNVFRQVREALKASFRPSSSVESPIVTSVRLSDVDPPDWVFEVTVDSLRIEPDRPGSWDVRFVGPARSWRELIYGHKAAAELRTTGSVSIEDPHGLLDVFIAALTGLR